VPARRGHGTRNRPPGPYEARMQAEVDLVKADLAYRVAFVKLMSLLGR
jgi:hypothetical protein